jgi:hypothetical protein
MRWINFGLIAMSIGVLFIAPHRMVGNEASEISVDGISIIAIEVLSDEMVMLRIKLEPSMPLEPVLSQQEPGTKPETEAQTVPFEDIPFESAPLKSAPFAKMW